MTVIHGSVLTPWKMIAVSRRPGARRGMATVPAVGSIRPARMCSSVVFPHPEGPINAQNSPARTENDTASSARNGARRPE